MGARDVVAAAVLLAAAPAAVLLSDRAGARAGVPAAVVGALALAVAVSWPTARGWVAWPGGLAAAVSLVATASVVVRGDRLDEESFGWAALAEMGGLLLLLALVARWSENRLCPSRRSLSSPRTARGGHAGPPGRGRSRRAARDIAARDWR